jgi:DNA mismatch endonuclease (patch repair protein)
MSRVRSAGTKIELQVRKALHARGFRYVLGGAGLAGRPDIVLPKYRAVIFVHGCFWHGHNCHLFRLPKTRPEFWKEKIQSNQRRDARALEELRDAGWLPIEIWECSLRGRSEANRAEFITHLCATLRAHLVD